jgi:hypothetical protein
MGLLTLPRLGATTKVAHLLALAMKAYTEAVMLNHCMVAMPGLFIAYAVLLGGRGNGPRPRGGLVEVSQGR